MMLPTHALAGMAIGVAVGALAPAFAPVAALAGLVGGVLPDLDMYAAHRKTLHFPVYYPVAAAGSAALALAVPTAVTVTLAVALLAAAVHSVADVFGGGLSLRPWEATSDRAVYDHHGERWVSPRRWVSYDGSPGDLLLTLGIGAVLLVAVDAPLRAVVLAAIGVGAVYAVVRKRLPALAGALARLPERFLPPA